MGCDDASGNNICGDKVGGHDAVYVNVVGHNENGDGVSGGDSSGGDDTKGENVEAIRWAARREGQ